MDTTDSTVSPAPAAEGPAAQTAHPLRGRSLVVCSWCALLLAAFLIGWVGAHTTRPKTESTATTDAAPSATQPAGQETVERYGSMTLLSRSASVDDLDPIGEVLDDPQWDEQPKQIAEPPAPRDVPESQRWQIRFPEGTTETEYARQLTTLGVELGVVRPDGTVEYLEKPGAADAKRRTGRRADEKRVYWTWSRGNLVKADQSLLKNAGIDAGEDLILHLWPPATAEKLTKLELEYKGRKLIDIFLTRFAIKRTFRGYDVYVEEQVGR